MWYMPYLRVRHATLVYAYIATGIALVAIALRFWPGAIHVEDARHIEGRSIDLAMIVSAAAALVGGFATVLGLNLAAENDGHLEVAWTKPISREGYALGVFAVDIAAMAACVLFTTVGGIIILDVYAGDQVVTFGSADGMRMALLFCGFPLSIYAWVAALSASLKRNRGTIAGLFWPLMFALGAFTFIPVSALHAVLRAVNELNPIAIYTSPGHGTPPSPWTFAWGWAVAALLLTAAVAQWRRLQL